MGRLINAVDLDAWWGLPVVLASGITSGAAVKTASQYHRTNCLLRLCKHLAAMGVHPLAGLKIGTPGNVCCVNYTARLTQDSSTA